jgi:DNA repair protein RadC
MHQLTLELSAYTPVPWMALPIHERPAERVAADSSGCNSAELVAALVGGPRQVAIAAELLRQFGSLHNLARASVADLMQVKGVGAATATRLRSALEISRRLLTPDEERVIVRSPADAVAVLQPLLMHREQEYLYVLMLDTRNRVMGAPVQIYHGSLNTALIRVGEVFREAVKVNAAGVILSHNHPSADLSPSPEDVAVTRVVGEAGKLLDVELLDHLILGGGRWVSLKERGLGFPDK